MGIARDRRIRSNLTIDLERLKNFVPTEAIPVNVDEQIEVSKRIHAPYVRRHNRMAKTAKSGEPRRALTQFRNSIERDLSGLSEPRPKFREGFSAQLPTAPTGAWRTLPYGQNRNGQKVVFPTDFPTGG